MQPMAKLCITVTVAINMTTSSGFDPGISQTTVRHATTRPLRPLVTTARKEWKQLTIPKGFAFGLVLRLWWD